MQYEHDQREEWLDWFVSPNTTDLDEIRTALESVPTRFDPWLFVETRLRVALTDEKRRLSGVAEAVTAGQPIRATVPIHLDPDGSLWRLAEQKEDLFYGEVAKRRPGGVRDSLSLSRK